MRRIAWGIKTKAAEQRAEARVRSQAVEAGFHFEPDQPDIPFGKSFAEPFEGAIVLTEAAMHQTRLVRRDISVLCTLLEFAQG